MKTLTAAIQFGSSRICAAAAWIDADGQCEVVGIESATTNGCIHHGCVVNVEDTAVIIKSLFKKLSNRARTDINAAYCGVCSISMHSQEFRPSMLVGDATAVSDEVKEQLRQMSLEVAIPNHDIIGLYDNGYAIGDQMAIGNHQLIVAESRLKQGICTAMERAQIRVAGIFANPLMLADILTDEEKRQGCLMLDMGAQLTTLAIYSDGKLATLKVIPFGGNSVTNDIASNNLRMEEAEMLKTSWSDASRPKNADKDAQTQIPTMSQAELNIIVSSRLEELAANVERQIVKAGFKGRLTGGCVLTGGASLQRGLTTLLNKRLEIPKISTRSCNTIRFAMSERKPNYAALMAMLGHCTESCAATPPPAPAPTSDTASPAPAEKSSTPNVAHAPSNTKADIGRNPNPSSVRDSSGIDIGSNVGTRVRKGVGAFFGDLFSGMD